MAQLGRGSRVKLLHLPPLALDAKDTVYFRQLTRGARVGMPQSLTTVHQGQFARDIPANLVHCADSPELPSVIEIAVGIPDAASDRVVFRGAIGALKVRRIQDVDWLLACILFARRCVTMSRTPQEV